MLSNTEYRITVDDVQYTVRIEYESVRGCFKGVTQIRVHDGVAVVICDSDGHALQVHPNIFSLDSSVDLSKFRQAAVEGKQSFLREISNETVAVRDSIFDKPAVEKEIFSTKVSIKSKSCWWNRWFGEK